MKNRLRVFQRARSRSRWRGVALGAAALTVSTALLAQNSVVTTATWNDTEWAHGITSTIDCENPEVPIAARGEGRALSGSLLGLDQAVLAEVTGVSVANDGVSATPSPESASAVSGMVDAYADPLNLALLSNSIDLDATGLLQLPLDTDTGLIGQFGEATNSGTVSGAGGYITDSGTINVDGDNAGYPDLATLKLSSLLGSLNHDLGSLLSNVTDVSLETGAVAGRASIEDPCHALWAGDLVSAVDREYLAAGVDTVITSPTVGALTTAIAAQVDEIESLVNGLASNSGVLAGVTGAVTGLLNGLISDDRLGLGTVTAAISATIDTSAIEQLLTAPFGDDAGVLTINPGDGTIRVNTAALLAATYPGQSSLHLNGLEPNTDLLSDPAIVTTLTNATGEVLGDWLTIVNAALDDLIDGIVVTADVTVHLLVEVCLVLICEDVSIGSIGAHVHAPLGELLAGTVTATTSLNIDLGLIGAVLEAVVEPIVNALLGGLTSGLGLIVGKAVEDIFTALRSLPSTVTDLAQPIVGAVSGVYNALFISGIVSVMVNAQNETVDPSDTEPADWSGLPDAQYDVAAIRIAVLDAAQPLVTTLYLGRGSVGPACFATDIPCVDTLANR